MAASVGLSNDDSGYSENFIVASYAFEMAFNLIGEWARLLKGVASKKQLLQGK
jgi:hypothetical protein